MHDELWSAPVVSGDGYATLLYSARCGGKTLDLAHLGADGGVAGRVSLPVDGYPWPAKVAAAPDGTVAVAWVDNLHAGRRQRVRVGVYGHDRWLRRPVTVFSRPYEPGAEEQLIDELAIDITPDHRVVVAYADEREVSAVVVPRSGRVPKPDVIGRSLETVNLVASVADNGRAAVAWGTHDAGEEVNLLVRIYATLREPEAKHFPRARLMERQPRRDRERSADEPDGNPHLALAPDGRALLSWDSMVGRRKQSRPLRVALARPGHGFGARRTLTFNANPGTVAMRDDGASLVTWTRHGTLYARLGDRDGHFSPRETVGTEGFPYASFTPDGRARVQHLTGNQSALKLHTAVR